MQPQSNATALATTPGSFSRSGFAIDSLPDLGDHVVRASLSPSARKAFFRIMDVWQVPDTQARELLGGISAGSYYGLKKKSTMRAFDQDVLTRISLLIGMYEALSIQFSKPLSQEWMLRPNTHPMFGGRSPLDYIIRRGLPGMMYVRQLLDSWTGGC